MEEQKNDQNKEPKKFTKFDYIILAAIGCLIFFLKLITSKEDTSPMTNYIIAAICLVIVVYLVKRFDS
jgi:heme/copper-type cytochrome/quinol oxidase subunit 4